MRGRAFLCFVWAAVWAAPPIVPEHLVRLAKAQREIARSLQHLPDYTCLETITRAVRSSPKRAYRNLDTVQLEVALVHGEELFAWPGERRFDAKVPTEMIGTGMGATGDFATHARNLFVYQGARISYGTEELLEGTASSRYDYQMSSVLGRYSIRFHRQEASSSAHGSFWLDAATLQLRRIVSIEDDLPAEFPVARAVMTVDYERVNLGGSQVVLLPQSTRLVLTERNGGESWNQTEFTHCRQYQTESAVSFDERASPAVLATEAKQEREIVLPAGVRFPVVLTAAIETASAKVGDAISAEIPVEIRQKGAAIVPKGARISGRVRRCETYLSPQPHTVVGLEFTEVQWEGGHARFLGELEEIDLRAGAGGLLRGSSVTFGNMRQIGLEEMLVYAPVPGVGTFFCREAGCRLPVGFRMMWQTRR